MKNNIKIGITIGDANGIGPEVIIKTFLEYKEIRNTTLIIYSSVEIIQYYIELLKFKLTFNIINCSVTFSSKVSKYGTDFIHSHIFLFFILSIP